MNTKNTNLTTLIDGCEWQPSEGRSRYKGESIHAPAIWFVGNATWRLCSDCIHLPEFRKYRKRTKIKSERGRAA